MAARSMNVVLFEDQQADLRTTFRRLNAQKATNVLLGSFLERVGVALREEAGKQSTEIRSKIPSFTTIFDLVSRYLDSEVPNAAITESLLCVCQLASFIQFFEARPGVEFNDEDTCIVGLGSGLLSSVAIASSQSITQLLTASVEAALVAFKTGLVVDRISQQLQDDHNFSNNWSMLINEVEEAIVEKELEAFVAQTGTPVPSKPYISAISKGTITISGPPARLRQLVRVSEFFRTSKAIEIPKHGLLHASHLFSSEDIQEIITSSDEALLHKLRPNKPIFSTRTGELLSGADAHELMYHVLCEMLMQPLRWDAVLSGTVKYMTESEVVQCGVLAFGASHAFNGLVQTLRTQTSIEVNPEDLRQIQEEPLGSKPARMGKFANSRIAIVGMAGRFPGAVDCESFWNLLENGMDVHRRIPADRFPVDSHYDPTGKKVNTSHTPFGCFIDEPGLFDARFFSMSPREAAQTDPMHRLAIVTAYEALEMAGFVPGRTPSSHASRVGTFYGQTSDDWREVNISQKIDTFFIPGGVRAFAPGRINYFFKFSGPSYSIDTAAIQIACTSLQNGECDTALSGGLNVLTAPDIFAGLSRGQFLSKSGGCKTFDSQADGYCRADGCGSVVLKRLEDAEADNDNILGVILGTATNHSAEAISITHPHAGAQQYLYESVLSAAGVDAHEISYVEMHGTGTQAGDKTEATSVLEVFAPRKRQRAIDNTLHLGAVKSNVGHGEAAAGITALVKMLMMLKKGAIPPHVGIKNSINPALPKDMKERNVHIAFKKTPWERPEGGKRVAFLNNFSAAGGNTALLLEDPPLKVRSEVVDPRPAHVVTISAKSITSIKANLNNMIKYISENPDVDLADLAYTTTARRLQYNYRAAAAITSVGDLKSKLVEALDDKFSPVSSTQPKVAFVYTGQGSFYPALGRRLFRESPRFKHMLSHLNSLVVAQGLPSFMIAVTGATDEKQALPPLVVQLTLVCIQIALTKLWLSFGIKPDLVIGHSLGDYAALYAAGVLSVSDAIHLVGQRAKLLQEKCTQGSHCMLAVKGSVSQIAAAAKGLPYETACINGKNETVVVGTVQEMDAVADKLKTAGTKCMKLDVPYAFHSAQVEPIIEPYRRVAEGVIYNAPKIPVMSPLLGRTITEAGIINADYLCRHARESVDFLGALSSAETEELVNEKTCWVEIGANPICSGMVRSSLSAVNATVASLRKNEDPWQTLAEAHRSLYLAGIYINWPEIHKDFDESHVMLDIPAYHFDSKNYWIDYVNDWCLTKADPPRVIKEIEAAPAPVVELPSKLTTTTVHKILAENFNGTRGTMTTQSDLSEPTLHTTVSGHLVNGAGLVPSSVYADMALTIGDYLYKEMVTGGKADLDCCNMEVPKPLIAKKKPTEPQLLRVDASADLETGEAALRFYSVTNAGKEIAEHAKCIVKFRDAQVWLDDWSQIEYLVKGRIDSLAKGVETGAVQKITRGIAYKLFAALVQYDQKFRGMEEVFLDSSNFEATSKVQFQTQEKDGNFFCSPYWIDSLAHISGFIINGSDAVDSKNYVYVSHGWKYMRFSKTFNQDTKYRSYVKMQPVGTTNMVSGDVYIFEDNKIIGCVGGLKFQRIPRQLLDTILPPEKAGKAMAASKAVAAPVARPTAIAPRPAIKVNTAVPPMHIVKPVQKAVTIATPAVAAPAPVSAPSGGSVTVKALEVICSEAEVDMAELLDECEFANLGIDSLLSLSIAGKFREELGLEIPSSVFIDCPTVGALKKFFTKYETATPAPVATASAVSAPVSAATSRTASPIAITPPDLDSAYASGDDSDFEVIATPDHAEENLAALIRSTIADQMELEVDEITGNVELASLGMDSLMTISILGSLREETGLNLSSEFFIDHPSMNDIENYLNKSKSKPVKVQNMVIPGRVPTSTKSSSSADLDAFVRNSPKAVSILLQGNPRTASKTLFIFPDGSGSATSYTGIPDISPDVAAFGLNCPFMTTPEKFTCGIEKVSTLYLNEVRRRQPHGPYNFAGWSAGGIVAYEVTQQLLAQGERVDKMILFDSPCPIKLEALPHRLHVFFGEIGLLGTGSKNGPPSWLLPHFESAIQALTVYKPKPIADKSKAPKTFAIWARDGVCKNPSDPRPEPSSDDPKSMKWLLYNRTDFGCNGWDELVGRENMTMTSLGNANHFSMMREPVVKELAALIRQGLE
ncbi:hypothetical protein MMC25_004355 [Agyrium rufum]|nr:hypothetical protein [Agyrium rufum]